MRVILCLLLLVAACSPASSTLDDTPPRWSLLRMERVDDPAEHAQASTDADSGAAASSSSDAAQPWKPWAGSCEPLDQPRRKMDHATRGDVQARMRAIIDAVVADVGASRDVAKLLKMVALRESSQIGPTQPGDRLGVVHRACWERKVRKQGKIVVIQDCPDRESSYSAWQKAVKAGQYATNPAMRDAGRWQTYGLYGMNSAIWTKVWDEAAAPEVLCDPVVATYAYLRWARHAVRQLEGTRMCPEYDEQGERDHQGRRRGVYRRVDGEYVRVPVEPDPTLRAVHRAVSGGKLCPAWDQDEVAAWLGGRFHARATAAGLDPEKRMRAKDFGEDVYADYERVARTWAKVLEAEQTEVGAELESESEVDLEADDELASRPPEPEERSLGGS
jgi:hypothetical protein